MIHRAQTLLSRVPMPSLRPAAALREVYAEGYSRSDLRADVMSGLVVGVVAVPLSMALAIASGVPPQHGLYTAIFAGGLAALLGGSRVQVTGPTAAFVVILAPVAAKFGLGGLALASMMAGFMLIAMGVCRFGRLIAFIPYPVTLGFTAGIAIVIATLQLKDLFGLSIEHMPDHYLDRCAAIFSAAPSFHFSDLAIGAGTLAVLILWSRRIKSIPAPLVALLLAAVCAWVAHRYWPSFEVATISSRFGTSDSPAGIPQTLPMPGLPWRFAAPGETPLELSIGLVRDLVPSALAIAMLGAIESLLSATVADGMSGHRHDPDSELLAQGVGNVVGPFFGGIAATGAIARTAANVRFGGRSPVAAITHALMIMLTILLAAPLLGYLPMAALAALLLIVAWNMSEARHVVHVVRTAPRSDILVLLTCLTLTVIFDMVVAVSVGVVLAALLFMQRMAGLADSRLLDESHHAHDQPLPEGMVVYEIAGPLFFGAAQKALSVLRAVQQDVHVVLIDLRSVPVLDVTGLVALQSAIDRLAEQQVFVVLAGVQDQPLQVMAKAHLHRDRHMLTVVGDYERAMQVARSMAVLLPQRAEPVDGTSPATRD